MELIKLTYDVKQRKRKGLATKNNNQTLVRAGKRKRNVTGHRGKPPARTSKMLKKLYSEEIPSLK